LPLGACGLKHVIDLTLGRRARCSSPASAMSWHGMSPRSRLGPEAARLARSPSSGACRVPASRKGLWRGPPRRTARLHARLPGRRPRAPRRGRPRTRRPRRRPPQPPPRRLRARPPPRRRPARRRCWRCGGRRRTRTARSSSRRAARAWPEPCQNPATPHCSTPLRPAHRCRRWREHVDEQASPKVLSRGGAP